MIDSKEDAEPPVVELTMDEKRSLVTARLKEREAARQAQNASRRENQDMGFMSPVALLGKLAKLRCFSRCH